MDKCPVVEDQDFILYLEKFENDLFIHCDVYKWNKTTRQKISSSVDSLLKIFKQPIYALHVDDDIKHRKFLDMFGFKLRNSRTGLDKKVYQIFSVILGENK